MTQVTAVLGTDPEVTIYEAAVSLDNAFPEALRGGEWGSASSAVLQALAQVSDRTLLSLASVVFTAPRTAWLSPKEQAEARALAEFLACRLAAMGQN
jgi:hypothetical protein